MFLGVVPDKCISQIIRSIDFSLWPEIYTCCSGTFRFERAIVGEVPGMRVTGNDVSVFSVPLGRYVLGEETPLEFVGQLAPIEQILEGKPYIDRLAALMVASDYAKFKAGKPNRFKVSHAWHYENQFEELIRDTRTKVDKVLKKVELAGFFAGDWVEHMRNGIEKGAGIVAFPPFWKGGYEKMFEFLSANIKWQQPHYELYDPTDLKGLVDEVAASGVPYCILSDQKLEGHEVVTEYLASARLPHYCYASTGHPSYRSISKSGAPFAYKPVDVEKLTEKSVVTIVETTGERMNFLKDVYLKKTIQHVTGLANYLVYVDGMLAGGMIYALSKYGENDTLYVLSDFSLTGRARLAKLIAKMTLSRTIIGQLEKRFLWRYRRVQTTAFTHNAVSMKYRGVMEVKSRRPADDPTLGNIVNYEGQVINDTPEQIYRWWWDKHARKAIAGELGASEDRAA